MFRVYIGTDLNTCTRRAPLAEGSQKDRLFADNTEWAKAIARNVKRKLPPAFETDDLEQEACIKLVECCERYDPENERGVPFQAFAYLPVRGAVLMSVRRKAWTENTAERVSDDMTAPRSNQPDVQLLNREEAQAEEGEYSEQSQWLKDRIGELPALDAYLVQRHHVDGMELNDLAHLMGVSRSWVGRRLAAAVKQLKQAKGEG